MKQVRYLLFAILAVLALSLWNAWQKEHPTPQPSTQQAVQSAQMGQPSATSVPSSLQTTAAPQSTIGVFASESKQIPEKRIVNIRTNVLNITVDKLGGKIIKVSLPKYHKTLKNKSPIALLNTKPDTFYIAQSGILKYKFNRSNGNEVLNYTTQKNRYKLGNYQNQLVVQLVAHAKDGLKITKTYHFKPNQYQFDVQYTIQNQSRKTWKGNYYMRIFRSMSKPKHRRLFGIHIVKKVSVSSPEKAYKSIKFSNLRTEPLSQAIRGGWLAVPDQYFLSAWVPKSNENYHYYTQIGRGDVLTAGIVSAQINLEPGQSTQLHSVFYCGPKIAKTLEAVATHLSMTIDYGWLLLWPISVTLFKILKYINDIIGNWGWSIIVLTILIKLLFYKLSATSYRSMAGMRKLQPKIVQLKERFVGDKQGMSKAMMELYKKEKINPLGGCLPILVQIPVFFALYWVLLDSVQLRQAPFMFWIHDLSAKDPYYILPVLMGLTMFIQQKLSPAPPDPTQAKIMMFLPIMMTVFFLNFPAGLVLYWLVNNILSVSQQWYVMNKYNKGTKSKKSSKSKK